MSTNELLSADLVDDKAPARRISEEKESEKEFFCEDGVPLRSARALSPWTSSKAKRVFDTFCVICSLPVALPILLLVGLAVRCTSHGPALFRQERMGCNGRSFSILKFRTMEVDAALEGGVVTTASDDRFTAIGPFLRRWKLDEVPQLFNVLMGQMSLVGPRPKVAEHQPEGLCCRPGITGAATIAFAREEQALDRIPRAELNAFYTGVVLPVKRQIDAEYMAQATFQSDLLLICNSLLGRWDIRRMQRALALRNARIPDAPQQLAEARGPLHRVAAAMRVMEVRSVEGDSM